MPLTCTILIAAAALVPQGEAKVAPEATRPVRGVLPKPIANALPIAADQNQVVVKLAEGAAALVADGKIVAAPILATIDGRPVRSLFAGLERELSALRARQLAATPASSPPAVDLSLYFVVTAADAADARKLLLALNALDEVELAYPRELPTSPPGDLPPVTPDYTTTHQTYRGPAPTGIDAEYARTVAGAAGGGVMMVEIEWGWNFDHEDIAKLVPSALIGPPSSNPNYNDHGVAVVGELVADADAYGMTGLVPDLGVRVATDYPASGYSVANAIAVGLGALQAGDLLVLEAQTNTPLGLGPTEWIQADFDAIFIATTLGIITVEAAGNGAVDLDAPALGGVFQRSVRDSGAILVGATNGQALARAPFSSFGSIVDANGWGYFVATTGYGNLSTVGGDPRQRYTDSFSGTSSATPMVAAAVAALRGAAELQLGTAAAASLDSFAIRSLLRSFGTAIPGQGIGRRVDLRALLQGAGLVRDLAIVGSSNLGQTCTIQLSPAPGFGTGDLFAIAASLDLAAQPVQVGGTRWLLEPSLGATLAFGVFGSPPAAAPITVPNVAGLQGLRIYAQGISLDVSSGALSASHCGEVFVRR
ncbi:MAG: hypothetical protein RL398_1783 [Planctomycetota bacterium]|jgi:hypothetical protein